MYTVKKNGVKRRQGRQGIVPGRQGVVPCHQYGVKKKFNNQKGSANPLMAVMVSPTTIRNLQRQIVNPRIKLLVEANKEVNNILYYFSLKHVNLKERKIAGCYWHSRSQKWLNKEFPFPNILYLRGGIKNKYAPIFEELFNVVISSNGKVINHPRFNKWQLYQIMTKDPVMKNYLPVTREIKQPQDIAKMLKEYKNIYLKSHLGRKGQNVLRVEFLTNGCYQYSYFWCSHYHPCRCLQI
ncbi:MAG: YheC/YheD family protein [Dethiobacteria bacterium]